MFKENLQHRAPSQNQQITSESRLSHCAHRRVECRTYDLSPGQAPSFSFFSYSQFFQWGGGPEGLDYLVGSATLFSQPCLLHWSPVNWPTDNGPARLFGQFLVGPNQYQLYYLTTRIIGQNVEALLFGQFLEAKTAGQLTGLQCSTLNWLVRHLVLEQRYTY